MSYIYNICFSYESVEDWLRGGCAVRLRITPRFWLFMIVTTVIAFSISIGVFQVRYEQGERELLSIREHRDALDLQVRDLNDELEYAQTDDFVIRLARDRLSLIMPNEIRYVNGAK